METRTFDLLIAASETNSHHGVGIFLQRLFPNSADFVCVRTSSLYGGDEPFGVAHHELCSRHLTLEQTEDHLRRILGLYSIRRILCVPYYREEFIHGILAKRITGAPLCTYVMDDQNIFAPHVPDYWVSELLGVSDLCLGISPEMCAAYERKYHRPIHLLPPVLEKQEPLVPCYWQPDPGQPLRAAMIGNVWTARRFERLRELLRNTGLELDWYGNGPKASWLPGSPADWEADKIYCPGYYPEEDLVAALASYPFVLVPSGTLDAEDDNVAFSRLSLPSRLWFLHGQTDTPVMLFGSPETAAGRFVIRLQTGVCVSADPREFHEKATLLTTGSTRQTFRNNIRQLAPNLVLPNAGEWLWRALATTKPPVAAFNRIFPPEYAAAISGLDLLAPARPRPRRLLPHPGEVFREEHAASFGFLRLQHLPVLASAGLELPAPEEVDLISLHTAVARYVLTGVLPAGGDVLFLGPDFPQALAQLPRDIRVWRIADLATWQQAGYAGDLKHVVDAVSGTAHPPSFPQFAAIVSTGWCGQMGSDPHALEGLSLYLEACTAPGGINLHLFPAVLHPTYFWVGPAYAYLRQRFLASEDWPTQDELLTASDLFSMSEQAYNKHWKPSIGKSYEEVGRIHSCGLYWRNPARGS